MTDCGHKWQAIHGFSGRYRCEWCGAIGYRRVILPGAARGRADKITVYICTAKGCRRPAVKVRRGPHNAIYQRCEKHDTERKEQP